MALSWVWIGMILTAAVYAAVSGTAAETGAAAAEGALAAVRLGAGLLGSIMFWSGLNEVMERAGITAALSRCLGPLLRRLYSSCREDGVSVSKRMETKQLIRKLDLPEHLSSDALLDVLNAIMTKEEFLSFSREDLPDTPEE